MQDVDVQASAIAHNAIVDVAPETSGIAKGSVFVDEREDGSVKVYGTSGMSAPQASVARPAIHWTVPGFKVGWRDASGTWFDEDGPRNGPPANYWRQQIDERAYQRDMEAVSSALAGDGVEEAVRNLELRNSAQRPSLNRKVLGSWAPVLWAGETVASSGEPSSRDGRINVPCTIDIYRSHGRRFGPGNRYGVFDRKLDSGEELTVKTSSGSVNKVVAADESNSPALLGAVTHRGKVMPLSLGRITYISDYLLIQRSAEGAVDLWLRADDSYLGVADKDLEYDRAVPSRSPRQQGSALAQ